MKLKKITIHNIASIEDAVINFEAEPLCEESRFLICGPTGSGKTTLLDAICLALYGTTPRLENAAREGYVDNFEEFKLGSGQEEVKIDDPRMLMRRGALNASAELVFTDRNNKILKSVWSCRRAHNKPEGSILDWEFILYNTDGCVISSKKTETRRMITERIGLTFEQFCRTTMLAQGDFTKFMKSNESEKSEILEKLTGTEIYSQISRQIHDIKTERDNIYQQKKTKCESVAMLSEEEREMLSQSLNKLEKDIRDLEAEIKYWSIVKEWLKTSDELAQAGVNAEKQLADYNEKVGNEIFTNEKILIEDWKKTETARSEWKKRIDQEKIITENAKETEHLRDEFSRLLSELQAQEKEIGNIRKKKQKLDSYLLDESEKGKAELYAQTGLIERTVSQMAESVEKIKNCRQNLITGTSSQIKEISVLENLLLQQTALEKEVEKAEVKHENLQLQLKAMNYEGMMQENKMLDKKKTDLVTLKQLMAEHARIQKETDEEKKELEEIQDTIHIQKQKMAELADLETQLEKERIKYQEIYDKQKLSCDDLIKEYRSRLCEGDVCPLCGQQIGHLASDEDFSSVLSPIREACEKAAEEYEKIHKSLADCKAALKAAENEHEKKNAKLKKMEEEYHTVYKNMESAELFQNYIQYENPVLKVESELIEVEKDIHAVNQKFNEYGWLYKGISTLQEETAKRRETAKSGEKGIEIQRTKINKIENEIEKQKQNIQHNEEQLEAAKNILEKYLDADTIRKADAQFIENLKSSAAEYRNAVQASEKMERQVEKLISDRQHILKIKTVITDKHKDWTEIVQDASEKYSPVNMVEEWNQLQIQVVSNHQATISAKRELEEAEKYLEEYFRSEGAVTQQRLEELFSRYSLPAIEELLQKHNSMEERRIELETAKKEIENRKLQQESIRPVMEEGTDFSKADNMVNEKRQQLDSFLQNLGTHKERLNQDNGNRLKYAEIRKEMEEAGKETERWEKLHSLFGSADGKKFRNIAQSYILERLLYGANHYLRQFTDRYEMACQPGSLTILLKDMAAGGVYRPTSTISGGEGFLISLSLALGLSSLSKASVSMDTLFIDEGFGTLDSTYLSAIMDALERLHQLNGKRIGIISHVESLRERITTQIQLIRVNSTLSRVEVHSLL